MKSIKVIVMLAMVVLTLGATARSPFGKKNNVPGTYMFGVAASFTDSLIYFTDIQEVADAHFNSHGLLESRMLYSLQLKDYLELQQHLPHRTCIVFYDKDKAKLAKKWEKLRAKYQKNGQSSVKMVEGAFAFQKPKTEE